MTEEAAAAPAETATQAKGKHVNGEAAAAAADGAEKGKRKFNNKQRGDEKPIEELFDLSQPIPKVRLSTMQFDTLRR